MAIEEEILATLRAGEKLPLAAYLTRFPALAEELLAFVVEHLDTLGTLNAGRDASNRTPLPSGMRAALEQISASSAKSENASRVAEEGTTYAADQGSGDE